MQVAIDPYDCTTAYADLRLEEPLSDALRERALERARELGAAQVEFWRAPYGHGDDRMAGFLELLRVPVGQPPSAVLTEAAAEQQLAQR